MLIHVNDAVRKFVFASGLRTVTVNSKPSQALMKAREELDRRCARAGREPPVGWDLLDITDGDCRPILGATQELENLLLAGHSYQEVEKQLCKKYRVTTAELIVAYQSVAKILEESDSTSKQVQAEMDVAPLSDSVSFCERPIGPRG